MLKLNMMISFMQLAAALERVSTLSLFSLLVSMLSSLSAMSIYMYSIATNLKWTFDFLLYHAFSMNTNCAFDQVIQELGHDDNLDDEGELLSIERYQHKPGSTVAEVVQCAVCLCEMEVGDEFRGLRCGHVFHRVCLDRWTGLQVRNPSCPLCRDYLAPARMITELGVEVLSFKFCTFRSDAGRRETWWLR